MKYIMSECVDASGLTVELPIIFPALMFHRQVAGQLASLLRNQHTFESVKVVSGGDCEIKCISTTGESKGLKVKALASDREVLDDYDMTLGIIDGPFTMPDPLVPLRILDR